MQPLTVFTVAIKREKLPRYFLCQHYQHYASDQLQLFPNS